MIFKAFTTVIYENKTRHQCKEILISCPDWESASIAAENYFRPKFADYKIFRISVMLTRMEAPLGSGVLEEKDHLWKDFTY